MNSAALPLPFASIPRRTAGLRLVPSRLAAVLGGTLIVSGAALGAVLLATGDSLAADFAPFAALAAALLALAGYCRWRHHPWRLTDSALIVAVVTVSLMLCGLVSCLGLGLGMPLADGLLARGDASLGFDVGRVTAFVAARPPLGDLLHTIYNLSGLGCVLVVLWPLLRGDRAATWRGVTTLVVAMQLTALVSIVVPAQGAIVSLDLAGLQGHGLPPGAGIYFAADFARFHGATGLDVGLGDLNGVVCFPSYHTVMALVIAQGLTRTRLAWPAVGWGAVTIVSTIPMGGHWMTDLAGGLAVWLTASMLADWACRPLAARCLAQRA